MKHPHGIGFIRKKGKKPETSVGEEREKLEQPEEKDFRVGSQDYSDLWVCLMSGPSFSKLV